MVIEYKKGLYGIELQYNKEAFTEKCIRLNFVLNDMFYHNQSTDVEIAPTKVVSTLNFAEYNILTFVDADWHSLYREIQRWFYHCYMKYHKKQEIKPHYIRSWLNVYEKNQYIDWHGHWETKFDAWHGFFCVNVEPNSKTSYMWKNDTQLIEINSKNGLLVLGLSNDDRHKSSNWEQEIPRITIAFDILPYDSLMSTGPVKLNHWIPI